MDDYVAKPVTTEALDVVLRRWVSRAPARVDPPPPPPRRSSSPAIDLGMLRQMRAAQAPGESDIVADVVALFLQDAPGRVTTLREGVARGDLGAAARAAHTLKGSAGHLGARTLTTLCERFDRKVRAGAPFDAGLAAGAIAEELDRVCAELAKEGGRG
jgi:HPt (histidine-containing phosphotransfer) domain-containing protein